MAEQVPAEAWQGDVIGPLVPQRWLVVHHRAAIIEYCVKYSMQKKIDATLSHFYLASILNMCDQLIGTTCDKDDELLVVDTETVLRLINWLY